MFKDIIEFLKEIVTTRREGSASSLEAPLPTNNESFASDTEAPLPKGILAFQSITTLLMELPQVKEMGAKKTTHNGIGAEREARILVALATILVWRHEVITVVALDDEIRAGDRMKVLACACLDVNSNGQPSQIAKKAAYYAATKNLR